MNINLSITFPSNPNPLIPIVSKWRPSRAEYFKPPAGVWLDRKDNCWKIVLYLGGLPHFSAKYPTEEEAQSAYAELMGLYQQYIDAHPLRDILNTWENLGEWLELEGAPYWCKNKQKRLYVITVNIDDVCYRSPRIHESELDAVYDDAIARIAAYEALTQ